MFLEAIPHIGTPRTHDDWTVTWEAIGAIGTILAALIPVGFWLLEHLRRKQAELLTKQITEDNELQEARKIAFWIEARLVQARDCKIELNASTAAFVKLRFHVYNGSFAPITQVWFGYYEHGEVLYISGPESPWPVLRPQNEDSFSPDLLFNPSDERGYFIEFLDHQGRKMRRDSNGGAEYIPQDQ